MNNIKKLEKIFYDYKRNLFRLENFNQLKSVDSFYNEEFKKKLKVKVDLVNNLLKLLPKEDEDFLVGYYINNKTQDDYYLSKSTFYSKLRKLADDFVGYFEIDYQ